MDAKAAGKGMSLLEIRDQLDVIDRQLTSLYQERMEYCAEVANIKIKSGKQVLDAKRNRRSSPRSRASSRVTLTRRRYASCFPRL